MKPIGLTFRHSRINLYTGRINGDLLIVHECVFCHKISCNRIAGDDDVYAILDLFEAPICISNTTQTMLSRLKISMLTRQDADEVKTALFGRRKMP